MGASRVNLGCGELKLDGYLNVDQFPKVNPDLVSDAHEFLAGCEDGSLDEIYAGHFLEHLTLDEAQSLLRECYRVLKSGGLLGITVPDTEAVFKMYVLGKMNMHDICAQFLYSTVQKSHHKWSYDSRSLRAQIEAAGFVCRNEIDRQRDPRVWPAWYQCGWDAEKP